ncbi:hypothetical protein BU17DRAFT_66242 [Hysterangium stoloniferum]|nr:hypothetical protein BU17DRAFT_66242 [Hysterangium stoloniferum]
MTIGPSRVAYNSVVPLVSLLSSGVRSILQFFHLIEPAPMVSNEFPGKMDVFSWHLQLLRLVVSDAKLGTDRNSPIITTTAVELRRMKQERGSEHEYFIARVHHVDNGTHYIRIERFGEEYEPRTASQRRTLMVSPSIESLMDRPALDEISTVSGWPGDRLLEKVNVTGANITLLDLATVATVVHKNDDQYKILKKQCYWFSDMIMRVLESTYKLTTSDRSPDSDKTWAANEYSRGGTYGGLRVHRRPRKADIDLVVKKFKEGRRDAYTEIQTARKEQENIRREREDAAENRGREEARAKYAEEREKLEAQIEQLRGANNSTLSSYTTSDVINHWSYHDLPSQVPAIAGISRP